MNLQYRIDLLCALGEYISSNNPSWIKAKEKAEWENSWFTSEFIALSTNAIARNFLQRDILENWCNKYGLPEVNNSPKTVGIVMAGNIPLVGFHDWLCVFISGHKAMIKTSSKDETLITHLVNKMIEWNREVGDLTSFSTLLKGCDAYIATGSNNSAGYFEYYFAKYPHIIRRNRTSVAILTGNEKHEELEKLADDVFLYFGLGCRNVTKLYVPRGYDFIPLISIFRKYDYLEGHHKYKNNFDYNLAINILNKKYYMSTPTLLLIETPPFFSPISQLNYEYYDKDENIGETLKNRPEIQCLVGRNHIPFGQAQSPSISDFADAVDTLQFLKNL